jgi:transcriptional regulator with XRE-family HTH domain
MVTFDMRQCGQRVKALRKAKHWRQQDLAAKAGLRAPHLISHIERGAKVTMQVETLLALAQALDCSGDYLLGLSDAPQSVAAQEIPLKRQRSRKTATTTAQVAIRFAEPDETDIPSPAVPATKRPRKTAPSS